MADLIWKIFGVKIFTHKNDVFMHFNSLLLATYVKDKKNRLIGVS